MANKRGLEVKDGKIYIDGVEYKAADDGGDTPSGPTHNTFNKICVFGTSIEASVYSPGTAKTWPQFMAEALSMTYDVQWKGYGTSNPARGVVNAARSGMSLTWWGNNYPTNVYGSSTDLQKKESASVLGVYAGGSFSPTGAERLATLGYFNEQSSLVYNDGGVEKKYIPDDMLTNALYQSIGYDVALLGQSDVDLYILGTLGINDRQTWMSFSKDGSTYNSYSRDEGLEFDRRTIYGAYNYVLRQLYARNPNAKVVILGQHVFNWDNQDKVNEIQRAVAYVWGIPFADWGSKLQVDMPDFGVKHSEGGTYLYDDAHLTGYGAEVLGNWVANWITETPLTSLIPNTNVLDLSDCPINPAMS